jgi:hypothetical protein
LQGHILNIGGDALTQLDWTRIAVECNLALWVRRKPVGSYVIKASSVLKTPIMIISLTFWFQALRNITIV